MAKQPSRIRIGLGILDGYSSDASYLSATGFSPKRGDIYFNTTLSRLRFYDGSAWQNNSLNNPIVRVIDRATVAIPSGVQTVDGVLLSVGDLVLMAASATAGIYKVDAGVWILQYLLPDPNGSATNGDLVFVSDGLAYAGTGWFYSSTWLSINPVRLGTTANSTLNWNGNFWVENATILTESNLLHGADNADVDAIAAPSITLRAANKTAGTGDGGDLLLKAGTATSGDGGDLLLQAGTSISGLQGRTQLDGRVVRIGAQSNTDPTSPLSGDLYFNTISNVPRFHDGSAWKDFASLPVGTFASSLLKWDTGTSSWTEDPTFILGDHQVSLNPDSAADAVQAQTLLISGKDKTAGTGDGGNIAFSAGSSVGGLGGSIFLSGRKIRLNAQLAADPADGSTTDVYFNTVDKLFKFYDGTAWQPFGTGSGGGVATPFSILNSQSPAATIFSLVAATYKSVIVTYQLVRGGFTKTGTLHIAHDGTNTSISDTGSSTGATGVTFSATISGSNLLVQYESDASGAGTMNYFVQNW